MSVYPMICVALAGDRSGFVIASQPAEGQEGVPTSQRTHRGSTLVVGSLYRISHDDEPEEWKVWLWPLASGGMRTGQSCGAFTAASPKDLEARLRKRADKQGPWWQAGAA